MRWMCFIAYLSLYPLTIFATDLKISDVFFNNNKSDNPNAMPRLITNEQEYTTLSTYIDQRSSDYPTYIVRINHSINNQQLTCPQVHEKINSFFIDKISKDRFSSVSFINCIHNPQTGLAVEYTVQSYFDPINDESFSFLKEYMHQYNGTDLLGAPFLIEEAKGLVVSLNFSVGWKKNSSKRQYIEYDKNRNSIYFKNDFEFRKNLFTDILTTFFSDDPNKTLKFLNKWFFEQAELVYENTLRNANFAQLEPEKIFLMEQGEPIFVSPVKQFFSHNCSVYEHQHCLNPNL